MNSGYDEILDILEDTEKNIPYENIQVLAPRDVEDFQKEHASDILDIQNSIYQQNYLLDYTQNIYSKMSKKQKIDFLKISCLQQKQLQIHQQNIQKIFNLSSQYRAMMLMHDLGSGKTFTALSIAMNFMEYCYSFQQRITIVVPGLLLVKNWKDDMVKYFKMFMGFHQHSNKQTQKYIDKYFRIITKGTFVQQLLIQKAIIKIQEQKKLDDQFIIIDEAHNLADIGLAQQVIDVLKISRNVRLLLLTATPMKNRADNIIDLLNILRVCNNPQNQMILKTDIFNYQQYVDDIRLKKDAKKKLQKQTYGYISYLRNSNLVSFAQPQFIGEIPYGLKFTYVIQCKIGPFQTELMENILKKKNNHIDFGLLMSSNFAMPKIDNNEHQLIPCYSYISLIEILKQLKNPHYLILLNKKITEKLIEHGYKINDDDEKMISLTKKNDFIQGKIFEMQYLDFFSTKLHKMMENIISEISLKHTITIYSNFKSFGTDFIEQALKKNGFIQYSVKGNQEWDNNTLDAIYGIRYDEFIKKFPDKTFYPCTFFKISGQETKEINQQNQKEQDLEQIDQQQVDHVKMVLDNIYNSSKNIDGRIIKIFLGSKVISEGITIENCGSLHIFDQSFNMSRMKQVQGRTIRWCKHLSKQLQTNEPDQKVKIHRYVNCVEFFKDYGKNEKDYQLSIEEQIIRKSEMKYILIKQVERILKENSIDCILNHNNNILQDDIQKFKNCRQVSFDEDLTSVEKQQLCPEQCDFTDCHYKCNSVISDIYYDEQTGTYSKEKKEMSKNIDIHVRKYELQIIKNAIQNIFHCQVNLYFYKLYDLVIQQLPDETRKQITEQMVMFQIGIMSINKYNNIITNDIIIYNVKLRESFIFSDGDLLQLVPYQHYLKYGLIRSNIQYYHAQIGEKNFALYDIQQYVKEFIDKDIEGSQYQYDMDYYKEKIFFQISAIIIKQEQEQYKYKLRIFDSARKNETDADIKNKGIVVQYLQIQQLKNIMAKLDIEYNKKEKKKFKKKACKMILNRMMLYEKYSDKFCYIILPLNDPKIIFPLNIYDRMNKIKNMIQHLSNKFKFKKTKIQHPQQKKYEENKYEISIQSQYVDGNIEFRLMNLGFKKIDDIFFLSVE